MFSHVIAFLCVQLALTVLKCIPSWSWRWPHYVLRGRPLAVLFIGLVAVSLLSCLWLIQSIDVAVFPPLLVWTFIVMITVIVLTTAQICDKTSTKYSFVNYYFCHLILLICFDFDPEVCVRIRISFIGQVCVNKTGIWLQLIFALKVQHSPNI